MDPATGQIVGQHQGEVTWFPGVYSHDESRLLQRRREQRNCLELEMVELPKGNTLWTKLIDAKNASATLELQFANNGSVVIVLENSIELWDERTGAKKASIWNATRWGNFSWTSAPSFTKDGKIAQFSGFQTAGEGRFEEWAAKWLPWIVPTEIILVADADSGQLLLQVPFQSYAGSWLTEDGRSLILTQGDSVTDQIYGHRAYDIPARPRWGWVMGVPAGVGTTVLASAVRN